MNIWITGGDGFIARNLFDYLHTRHITVIATGRTRVDLLSRDSILSFIRENNINIVIHTAMSYGQDHLEDDLRIFFNLSSCSGEIDKLIYFGSMAEFDVAKGFLNFKESDFGKQIPRDNYGLSKYIMNLEARRSANIYNLRLFCVFGKYDRPSRLIPDLCHKGATGQPINNNQNKVMSFLPALKLCMATDEVIKSKPEFHDYNLCLTRPYSFVEVTNMVRSIFDKPTIASEPVSLFCTGDPTRFEQEFSLGLETTDIYPYIREVAEVVTDCYH